MYAIPNIDPITITLNTLNDNNISIICTMYVENYSNRIGVARINISRMRSNQSHRKAGSSNIDKEAKEYIPTKKDV